MDREEDRFFVNIDRWPQDEATPFTLLSSFVYNPSTGLRKDTGSRYLPTREVYTSNPNESSGNALVRGFIHGPLPMLRRRMGVWKKALGASLRNILLKILLALSSISTMTLLLLYLFLFRARNKAEQRRQPRHWQWQHYRQTYLTDDSQTLYDDDADFPPLCKRAQRSSARDRKSTRLNSSHLGISYAVFCLNKKKENDRGLTGASFKNVATRNGNRLASRRLFFTLYHTAFRRCWGDCGRQRFSDTHHVAVVV